LNSQLAEKDLELESLSVRVDEQVAGIKLAHQKEIESKQLEIEALNKAHNEELQRVVGKDSILLMAARILVSGRHSSSWIQVLECIISCSIKNGGKEKGCTFNELFAEMLVKYNISHSKSDAVMQSIDSLVNHGRLRVDQTTKRIYLA